MPRIKDYNGGSNVQGPIQMRGANPSSAGRGLEALGSAISQTADVMNKRAEQAEISQLAMDTSQADADFTNKWQEQTRAGTVDTNKFMEEYNTHMDGLREKVSTNGGSLYFDRQRAQSTEGFLKSVNSAQAEVAGQKAKQSAVTVKSNFSAVLRSDPSSLELKLQKYNEHVDELVKSGMLPSNVADEERRQAGQEFTKASIQGWIDLNPEQTKKYIEAGKWDSTLSGDLKNQMMGQADEEIRGRRAESIRFAAEQERVKKQQQEGTQSEFLDKLQNGSLSWKDVKNSNLDAFGSGSKESFRVLMEQNAKQDIKDNPHTLVKVFDRIHLPDGDPKKITDPNELNKYLGKGLSLASIKQYREEIVGTRTPEGKMFADRQKQMFKEADALLVKKDPMGLPDANGMARKSQFMAFAQSEVARVRKEGGNVYELMDANSPKYLGRQILNYKPSQQDIINEMVSKMQQKTNEAKGISPANNIPPPPEGKIPVMKDGKKFFIFKDKLADAKARGYEEVK